MTFKTVYSLYMVPDAVIFDFARVESSFTVFQTPKWEEGLKTLKNAYFALILCNCCKLVNADDRISESHGQPD